MFEAHQGKICLTFKELNLMMSLWRNFCVLFWVNSEIIDCLRHQVIDIDALAFASLNCFICELVSLLSKLVDGAKSFLVLFLVLKGTLLHRARVRGRSTHLIIDSLDLFILAKFGPSNDDSYLV